MADYSNKGLICLEPYLESGEAIRKASRFLPRGRIWVAECGCLQPEMAAIGRPIAVVADSGRTAYFFIEPSTPVADLFANLTEPRLLFCSRGGKDPLRLFEYLKAEQTEHFTVEFGRIARTINYKDRESEIIFCFDLGPRSVWFDPTNPQKPSESSPEVREARKARTNCFLLERAARDEEKFPQYNIAFERVKKFLESCGYEVEV